MDAKLGCWPLLSRDFWRPCMYSAFFLRTVLSLFSTINISLKPELILNSSHSCLDLQPLSIFIKGTFSSSFIIKFLGFSPSFCIIELNNMQKFWQKCDYSSFWILASRGQKNPKEPHEALMKTINSVFFMELNITLKILTFCISLFQSSWYFIFFAFYEELNTP